MALLAHIKLFLGRELARVDYGLRLWREIGKLFTERLSHMEFTGSMASFATDAKGVWLGVAFVSSGRWFKK